MAKKPDEAATQAATQADAKVAPPAAPELVTVEVIQPVDHDGVRYAPGTPLTSLTCDPRAADALRAAGAVRVPE